MTSPPISITHLRSFPVHSRHISLGARAIAVFECLTIGCAKTPVGLLGLLQIVFVWDRPLDVPAGVVPSLSWGYARLHGSAALQGRRDVMSSADPSNAGSCPGLGVGVGFAAPVLARGWGKHLQLLQARPRDLHCC
jgi:hypothetical protein